MTYLKFLALSLVAWVLVACGGANGAGPIGNSVALYISAPGTVTLTAASTSSYTIGGGVAPYTGSSGNNTVATVAVSGTSLSITGLAAGTAQITVLDATGKSVATAVTVGAATPLASPTTFWTTAPSTVTVGLAPAAADYALSGGTGPYLASTSNTAVAMATITGSSVRISGVSAGTAQVSLFDATGAALRIAVTVGSTSATALYMTAPSTITSTPGAVLTFALGGGAAPYTVSSGNASVATASVNGASLSISALASGQGEIRLTDAKGAAVSTVLTVGSGLASALYVTAPGAITVALGTAQVFTVAGGAAPYVASSSNTGVTVANVLNGNTLSIAGISAGGPAQVVVFDSAGKSAVVTVTVGAGGGSAALYTTAPVTLTIGTVGSRSYSLGGGVGAYSAVSSNDSVATASVAGSTLTINGLAAGTATIIARDAANATVSIAVTVGAAHAMFTTAPAALTLAIGAAPSYAISAGAAPYVTSSSNSNVATATVNGSNLTLNAVAAGSANIIVLDSTGTLVTIAVSVGAGSHVAIFSTVPAAITIATGAAPSYAIGGGTAPYTATSSNTTVLTASVSGDSLNLLGLAAGSANVVVRDAVGDIAGTVLGITTSVTVTPVATTPLAVFPSASAANVGDVLNFSISGGSPAYSVSVNNPSIASVSQTGNSFTARLLNVGATTVAIVDQLGQTSTLSLTVNNPSSLMRLSPSALQVSEDDATPIPLSIYGGTAPYTAYTSDLQLSSVAVAGSQYTVSTGVLGARCVNLTSGVGALTATGVYDITLTVVDSLGASATSILTIKDNGKGVSVSGC